MTTMSFDQKGILGYLYTVRYTDIG